MWNCAATSIGDRAGKSLDFALKGRGLKPRRECHKIDSGFIAAKGVLPQRSLNLAVIIVIIPILMAQVLHRAQGAAVFRVTDFDSSVYILQFDSRAATCQFSTKIVADIAMMIDVQAEVIVNSTGNRAGVNLSLGV